MKYCLTKTLLISITLFIPIYQLWKFSNTLLLGLHHYYTSIQVAVLRGSMAVQIGNVDICYTVDKNVVPMQYVMP